MTEKTPRFAHKYHHIQTVNIPPRERMDTVAENWKALTRKQHIDRILDAMCHSLVGPPEAYAGDLVRDGATIARIDPDKTPELWWIVRPHGTHIAFTSADRDLILDVFDVGDSSSARVFHFTFT